MKVPQLSPWLGNEEYKAIKECFKNNWITEGPISKKFQEELLKLCGAKYGVFAPNGTLAIYLALRAIDISYGDEVIVPDFTFLGSASAVEMVGAVPVFVDVNRKNFQIDLSNADKLVTKKTKAVMPVHIYGTVADMEQVQKFAKKHNLKIIEDAAEAVGVFRNGKHAGTFGEIGTLSFFADKTITTGEGGFVVTNNEKIYNKLLLLRNQGRINRGSFIHPEIGYNFRMTDLQNAVGLVQLRKLPEIVARKRKILKLYLKLLKDTPQIQIFEPDKESDWIPFRFCIVYEKGQQLMEYMKQKDIETRSFFYPMHLQPGMQKLSKEKKIKSNLDKNNFPNSTYGYECGVCLPIFPTLTETQVKYVCKTIKDFIRAN